MLVYYHYTTARFARVDLVLCRGAGNRTRSTRTRSVRTTGILHPDEVLDSSAAVAFNDGCTFQDLNLRPFECESNALTN